MPVDDVDATPAMVRAGLQALAEHFLGLAQADPEVESACVIAVWERMLSARTLPQI